MARVLYIEDNRDNRMLIRRVLMASDHNFVVQEADSAIKGIEMARSSPPDLILMDLSMPEMDGLTATQQLRNFPELAHVPIVALTANAMTGDKERSLQAGCDGYISKPIDVDKIADEVYRFLSIRLTRTAHVEPATLNQIPPEKDGKVGDPVPEKHGTVPDDSTGHSMNRPISPSE